MSAAKCTKCGGMLPAWLTAAGGATTAKCPNCAHVNDLVAMRTPPPQTVEKSPDVQPAVEGQGASKAPALNKTMFMASGAARAREPNGPKAPGLNGPKPSPGPNGQKAPPAFNGQKTVLGLNGQKAAPAVDAQKAAPPLDAQKADGLAKTMFVPQAAPAAAPAQAKPAQPVSARSTAAMAVPELPPTTPLPVAAPPPAVVEAAAAALGAPEAPMIVSASIDSGETDADVDVEVDTPPPAPPSNSELPSWAVSEPLGDGDTGAILGNDRMAFLRSRPTLIGAGAVGLVGLVLGVVMLSRGGKPHGPVSVEVKPPPVQKFTPPPAPEPEAEPVRPAPEPRPEVARKAPEPRPEPARKAVPEPRPEVARKAPEPPAPRPEPARKAAEPARPRPVAAAPAPAPKMAAASAPHASSRRSGVPSEDDQRQSRDAYARGNTQLYQGHAAEAITSFKDALRLDPRNPTAMRGLGLAYGQTGSPAQAVQYLKRYLKASPTASDRALVEKRIEQLSAR